MATYELPDAENGFGLLNYLDESVQPSLFRNGAVGTKRDPDGNDFDTVGLSLKEKSLAVSDARGLSGAQRPTCRDNGFELLDAPIEEYLPGFDTQGHAVTVRHLLSHTSGIRSYSDLYAGTGRQPVPRAAVLDTLQRHPFDFAPG